MLVDMITLLPTPKLGVDWVLVDNGDGGERVDEQILCIPLVDDDVERCDKEPQRADELSVDVRPLKEDSDKSKLGFGDRDEVDKDGGLFSTGFSSRSTDVAPCLRLKDPIRSVGGLIELLFRSSSTDRFSTVGLPKVQESSRLRRLFSVPACTACRNLMTKLVDFSSRCLTSAEKRPRSQKERSSLCGVLIRA